MDDSASPMVLRRRLRTELVAARDEKGLTQQYVAEAMDWSMSKINRIERAKSKISINDLRQLLPHYGITDPQRESQLVALARGARKESWWHAYKDVASEQLLTLIDYESVSSAVHQFEATFVPGIAQTEGYAEAVLQAFFSDEKSGEVVRRLVELRTRREQLLEGGSKFHFVLDESVLRRKVGSASLMREQLKNLLSVARLPNVVMQVMPFTAGLHRGMGAFEIVYSGDTPDDDAVFVEGFKDFFLDNPEDIQNFSEIFDQITEAALTTGQSLELLEAVSKEA